MHQLGALYQEKSKGQPGPLTNEAIKYLMESRNHWQARRNHREGFSLRRLARIHASLGRYVESLRYFIDAIEVFARCRCRRYVEQTRKDLEEFVIAPIAMRSLSPAARRYKDSRNALI